MHAKRIIIEGKTFEMTIPETTILESVRRVADRLRADYADKNPVFVVVLNGAFVFASDLLRLVDYPAEVTFTKLTSYSGMQSTGRITEQLGINTTLSGRHVIIVEDIVETGYSMQYLQNRINEHNPASLEICALTAKPEKMQVDDVAVKYVGMQLPEAFIVGYGLDYNQQGRLLRDIYSQVSPSEEIK